MRFVDIGHDDRCLRAKTAAISADHSHVAGKAAKKRLTALPYVASGIRKFVQQPTRSEIHLKMSGPPPPGQQATPQQMAAMQQQIALEAQKRGMTPQQFQNWQRQQIEADAKKNGMTVEQYIAKLKQQAFENHQRQQQAALQQAMQQQSGQPQIQGQQQGQQVPITPGAPDPKGLAVAKWLRSQDLKPRTCIVNGQRKDMFRGKLFIPCSFPCS